MKAFEGLIQVNYQGQVRFRVELYHDSLNMKIVPSLEKYNSRFPVTPAIQPTCKVFDGSSEHLAKIKTFQGFIEQFRIDEECKMMHRIIPEGYIILHRVTDTSTFYKIDSFNDGSPRSADGMEVNKAVNSLAVDLRIEMIHHMRKIHPGFVPLPIFIGSDGYAYVTMKEDQQDFKEGVAAYISMAMGRIMTLSLVRDGNYPTKLSRVT